jgi:hypothetical protein
MVGTEAGLKTNHRLNNDYSDQVAGAHTLTEHGSPAFTTNVPFSDPTARQDLDQSLDTTGQTYALTTGVNESVTHRQTFIPAKDPQKSVQVNIGAKGSGNWTLVVHDGLNRALATATATNAQLTAGDYEFVFATAWRPILGASYHFHVYSTVADGTVVSTGSNDMETADFHTYYQFLVEDVDFHPTKQMLNFIAFGNERYLATYDASSYNPHRLTFPAGWRVRSLGYWLEYLAIGVWKGTSMTQYDEGRIFFWDGFSTTYNFSVPIPQGGINALFGSGGELHIFAGYQGDHLLYTGGSKATKVERLPKITNDKTTEVYPGAVLRVRAIALILNAECIPTGQLTPMMCNRLRTIIPLARVHVPVRA